VLDNPAAILIAILGSGGLGLFIRELATLLKQRKAGVSAREATRKRDLVIERDYEFGRAEVESRNRRRLEEYASKLRVLLIEKGFEALIPKWPKLELLPERETMPESKEKEEV
jgi:hypothetical protein